MLAAITGISTIWIVIGVGWLMGHVRLATTPARQFLSVLAFTIASPALLFKLVAQASLEHVFSHTVLVSIVAIVVTAATYLVLNAFWFRRGLGGSVIGLLASCYTNAANFGLPVALALLGDATWMAPIMLVQVAIMQPIGLALLDVSAARSSGKTIKPTAYLLLPFRNPITVGILLGLLVNVIRLPIPDVILKPVDYIGAMAVPAMLLAFGISLRLDPLPGGGPRRAEMWWTVLLKVVLHPLVAWAVGRFAFGLTGGNLYAVTVLGALPAAQNVFIMASRYEESELLARDSVFWSTILSVVSLLMISAVLG